MLGGEQWIEGLRKREYKEVVEELQALKGVGRKVADCIALFSLDCRAAIPVDTHMF